MTGDRTPTWQVAADFARACDADPDDLVFLWNTAHGLPSVPSNIAEQAYVQAIHALQAALRGLHLADARPDIRTLTRRRPTACPPTSTPPFCSAPTPRPPTACDGR